MPSTRFRWDQYVPDLQAHGLHTTQLDARYGAYPPERTWRRVPWLAAAATDAIRRALATRDHDVCFLQRHLVSTLDTAERWARRPLVFDVDDSIHLGPRGASADRIASRAALVVCGNDFLAEHYAAHANVAVLPTAVDTQRFVPGAERAPGGVIGWSGSSSGFAYLRMIEPALAEVMRRRPDTVFKVVADRAPTLPALPADRLVFEPWKAASEVAVLQGFDVGLMPLHDDAWARGKCSFKMLTYMAAALPVVVSPVGMNVQVLAHGPCGVAARSTDEWVNALLELLDQPTSARAMGHEGRRIVEAHYCRSVVGTRLAALLRSVL